MDDFEEAQQLAEMVQHGAHMIYVAAQTEVPEESLKNLGCLTFAVGQGIKPTGYTEQDVRLILFAVKAAYLMGREARGWG